MAIVITMTSQNYLFLLLVIGFILNPFQSSTDVVEFIDKIYFCVELLCKLIWKWKMKVSLTRHIIFMIYSHTLACWIFVAEAIL